jgi:hypothetical protein
MSGPGVIARMNVATANWTTTEKSGTKDMETTRLPFQEGAAGAAPACGNPGKPSQLSK